MTAFPPNGSPMNRSIANIRKDDDGVVGTRNPKHVEIRRILHCVWQLLFSPPWRDYDVSRGGVQADDFRWALRPIGHRL